MNSYDITTNKKDIFFRCKCGHEFEQFVDRCVMCGRPESYFEEIEYEDELELDMEHWQKVRQGKLNLDEAEKEFKKSQKKYSRQNKIHKEYWANIETPKTVLNTKVIYCPECNEPLQCLNDETYLQCYCGNILNPQEIKK